MWKRLILCVALILTACRTNQPTLVQNLPPSPPGLVPKIAIETPRLRELLVRPEAPITGFAITNLSINGGSVNLAWQSGQSPFQIQESSLNGTWKMAALPTMSQSQSISQTTNHFYRLQQNVNLGLILTSTNGNTLTFTVPTLDMSDSYKGTLRLYKTTDGVNRIAVPGGSTSNPKVDGTALPTAGTYTVSDSQAGSVTYGVDDNSGGQIITTNGVVIPFSTAVINNVSPGGVLWAVSRATANAEIADAIVLDGNYVLIDGISGGVPTVVKLLIGSAIGDTPSINQPVGSLGYANGVAVDSSHNIYIANGQNGISDTYEPSQWFTKLNSSGIEQWHKSENAVNGAIECYSVCVDSSQDILVCGGYWGTVNFGDGPVTGAGVFGYTGFSAKYHPDGSLAWKKLYSSTEQITPTVIRLDATGNIYVGGRLQGTTPDSPSTGTLGGPGITSSHGSHSPFLVKYHSDGTFAFSKSIAQNSLSAVDLADAALQGQGMAVSPDGHVAFCGVYVNAADFGGGLISVKQGQASFGGYLVLYDCSGTDAVWKWNQNLIDQSLATSSFATASGVGIDSANNVVVTGRYVGFVNFDASTVLTAQHNYDLFITKYDVNGVLKWPNGYTIGTNASGGGQGYAIVMDSSLNVYCTGYYIAGTAPFGSYPLPWSGGSQDIFIVKLAP